MLVVQPVAPQLPWWSSPGREELLVLEAHHPLRCQNHGHADRPAMAHRIRKVLWRESPCRGVEKLGNARIVKHMLFLRNKLISFFFTMQFYNPGLRFRWWEGHQAQVLQDHRAASPSYPHS